MCKKIIFVLICATLLFSSATCFSQDEDTDYSYGTIVEVRKEANEIVVSEYDWDNDAEAEVTYAVHPKAEVENAASWKEIPNGAYIDIEYMTDERGKKVATYISAYEAEPEE